jgi:hypothetical protein
MLHHLFENDGIKAAIGPVKLLELPGKRLEALPVQIGEDVGIDVVPP